MLSMFFFILIAVFCGSISLFNSSYFRLENYYGLGQFAQSGYKIIFFLIVVIYFINNFIVTDYTIYFIYLISLFIPSLLILHIYRKSIIQKIKIISISDFIFLYKYGFLFFGLNILNMFIVNMERFSIPLLYGNEEIGIYSALTFLYITVFTMIGTSMGMVLFPELSKNREIQYSKIFSYGFAIIIFLTIIFYFSGFNINHLIFDGKYDLWRTKSIDLMIIFIGSLQFINGLLHWYILGSYGKKEFYRYAKLIITVLLVYILLIISL